MYKRIKIKLDVSFWAKLKLIWSIIVGDLLMIEGEEI